MAYGHRVYSLRRREAITGETEAVPPCTGVYPFPEEISDEGKTVVRGGKKFSVTS